MLASRIVPIGSRMWIGEGSLGRNIISIKITAKKWSSVWTANWFLRSLSLSPFSKKPSIIQLFKSSKRKSLNTRRLNKPTTPLRHWYHLFAAYLLCPRITQKQQPSSCTTPVFVATPNLGFQRCFSSTSSTEFLRRSWGRRRRRNFFRKATTNWRRPTSAGSRNLPIKTPVSGTKFPEGPKGHLVAPKTWLP